MVQNAEKMMDIVYVTKVLWVPIVMIYAQKDSMANIVWKRAPVHHRNLYATQRMAAYVALDLAVLIA